MSDEVSKASPKVPIKEFREMGLVQEINRRLLHPLGMALAVEINDVTGREHIVGIIDHRNDPEGMVFADLDTDEAREKYEKVQEEWEKRTQPRASGLGFMVQPIGHTMPKQKPDAPKPNDQSAEED